MELNDLYSSPNIVRVIKSRRMRWAGHVARMGEERGVYRFLVGKPDGKRPLGRPRRRWVELNDLYSSPNIVRVIKSRRMRWVGHVARIGEERGFIGSWWGNRREGDHWGDLGVDGWS